MVRGEVYYVDLPPVIGSEQGRCRPCVVIQNDYGNCYSGTTIVAPMTTQTKKRLPTHVRISACDKLHPQTTILLEQIRVVDKQRIQEYVCRLCGETMERIDKAIKISLALNKEERSEGPMNEIIVVNNHELKAKEFNGQRVVTFKDIDMVHERPDGTARRNFNVNRQHFIEGEDFFVRKTDEAKKEFGIAAPNGLVLIAESGYLMIVKSLTDDLAWEVQRKLVKSYFNKKKQLTVQEIMREQLGMIDDHESRIENLENTMNIDYGQQRVLEKEVASVVIESLGGKGSNAYSEMSKKVFSECNRDVKDCFHVNSRNNIPRIRFDDAVEYKKPYSIPVREQSDIDIIKAYGGNPVVVPYKVANLLKDETSKRIQELITAPAGKSLTLKERFQRWYDAYSSKLGDSARQELAELINEV